MDLLVEIHDAMNSVSVSIANLEKRIEKVEASQNLLQTTTLENQLIRLLTDLSKRVFVINIDFIFDINIYF